MKKKLLVLLILLDFVSAGPKLNIRSDCPNVTQVKNFDIFQFIGTWFIISSFPDKSLKTARCAVVSFSMDFNSSKISVFRKIVAFGREMKFLGSAASIGNSGILLIDYPALTSESGVFSILDTDYENYAILFACSDYTGFINGQNLVVLGRKRSLELQFQQRILLIINANNLPIFLLKPMDQSCNNSPYIHM